MIIEEVKKYLELRFKCGQVDYKFCENFGFDCNKCPYHHDDTFKLKAHEITIQAIEKQIPKKPIYEADGYADGYLVYDTWRCPNCDKAYEVDYDDYDYCPNCGQKLGWED